MIAKQALNELRRDFPCWEKLDGLLVKLLAWEKETKKLLGDLLTAAGQSNTEEQFGEAVTELLDRVVALRGPSVN